MPLAMNLNAFLFVDVGNTRVKWASVAIPGYGPSGPADIRAIPEDISTTKATLEFVRRLAKEFPRHYLVLSSVVPEVGATFCRVFKRRFHAVTAGSPALGITFDYPKPAEIGADRLAAAAAIHADGKFPAIIVACGTATAFTALDAKGRLCGGAIAPGPQAQLDSLLRATAQLPAIELSAPKKPLAKSTGEAIRTGVMLGFRGGIEKIVAELSDALPGREKPRIILTGGNAPLLAGALEISHTLRPLLVFEGLHIIGKRIWHAESTKK